MKDKIKQTILSILEQKKRDGDVLPFATSIEVAKFKAYYIKSSCGLFGDFQDGQPIGALVFALNPHHAIRRYMKRYYRMYKEQHRFYRMNYAEVTRDWGRIRVMTCDGYKRYYM